MPIKDPEKKKKHRNVQMRKDVEHVRYRGM